MKQVIFNSNKIGIRLFLMLALSISGTLYSQDSYDEKFEKIKKIYETEFWGDKPEELFYNKMENIVDISIYQIPLDIVDITYVFEKKESAHTINFACHEDRSCLGERIFQMRMRLKSKSGCYEFINALTDLNEVWISKQ